MSWRTARCIDALRKEVDAAYPARPKGADGTIGDARHQAEKSDHNPNAAGVVTAWDITTADFTIALAEKLRLLGKGGDLRVKYVIYRGRIASSKQEWAWRTYSGVSPHFDHIHLSVSADPKQYDRTDPWHAFAVASHAAVQPTPTTGDDDMTPEQDARLKNIEELLTALVAPRRSDHADSDPRHLSLGDVMTDVEGQQ